MSTETLAPPADDTEISDSEHAKYLTFTLDDTEFGVPILRVREIIATLPITAVPDAPHCIRGVINLRGKVIPVMDLRMRFELGGDSSTFERACIIVIEVEREGRLVDVGLLVDAVQEVFVLEEDQVEASGDFRSTINAGCISGLANSPTGIKVLIDVDTVLSESQLGLNLFENDAPAAPSEEA